jgi:V8-like Glu-specific endopeptidase
MGAWTGNDWMYMGTFPNSNTRLTAFEAQKKTYILPEKLLNGSAIAVKEGMKLEIIGYGVTYAPFRSKNQVQQRHSGKLTKINVEQRQKAFVMFYQVDTTGGNSGSAVEDAETGYAVGIHTNGGCRWDRRYMVLYFIII